MATDIMADYERAREIAARHALPDAVLWAQVTLTEATSDEVTRIYDDCQSGTFCGATRLVVVTWRARNDVNRLGGSGDPYAGPPAMPFRHVLCAAHLEAPLTRLLDRCLHDPSPDSPREIAVQVAVGPEWAVRWSTGVITPVSCRAEALRRCGLAPGAVVARRDNADDEWAVA